MTSTKQQSALACGADLDALTAQVLERRPPPDPEHQAGCRHCRAALAELRELWSPVHALADEEVVVPKDLLNRVLVQILELDYSGGSAVIRGVDGDTAIAVRVVAVVARRAADRVSGNLLTMSRVSAAVEVGAVGRSVVVSLDIIAELGAHLPSLSRAIQRLVREHVVALTGLSVVAVDVQVVDVAEGVASH